MNIKKVVPIVGSVALLTSASVFANHHTGHTNVPLGSVVETDEVLTKVISVDSKKHQVTVENRVGKPLTIQLTDAAMDLNHVKKGDDIALITHSSILFDLNTKTTSKAPTVEEVEGIERATASNPKPGDEAFRVIRVQLKIIAVNKHNHEIIFEDPNGLIKVIAVKDKKLQKEINKLKPNEMINVTFVDTLNIVVANSKK